MDASVARRLAVAIKAFIPAAILTLAAGATAAGVQIVCPAPEQILPGPDVPVQVATEGFTFTPGGCNLHIILDDGHFAVQYDPAHPFLLRDVPPGSHTLRVFVADRLHRAIPGTLDMVVFSVGYQDDLNRPSPGVPLLTVNLPQGEYLGVDAGDVAIDFMVDGVPLSRHGYHVAYYVNGRKFYAYNEGARHLKGLPPGLHAVRFELLDERGRLVPGRYNAWEKVILLSPHKTRHIPTEEDVRRGMPLIESIPGAMTNGQPWIAGIPGPIALPQATPVSRTRGVAVAGAPAGAPVGAPVVSDSGFAVRPGGRRVGPLPEQQELPAQEPGLGVVDLDAGLPGTEIPRQTLPPTEAGEPVEEVVTEVETQESREEVIEKNAEPLSVAPARNGAKAPAASAETEESEESEETEKGSSQTAEKDEKKAASAEEKNSSDEDADEEKPATGKSSDRTTTSGRDLRPASYRSEPRTTTTLRVDREGTRTAVRRIPTPKPVGSGNVTTGSASRRSGDAAASGADAASRSADAAARAARVRNQSRGESGADAERLERRRARREAATEAESPESGGETALPASVTPNPDSQLPTPKTPSRRVGP